MNTHKHTGMHSGTHRERAGLWSSLVKITGDINSLKPPSKTQTADILVLETSHLKLPFKTAVAAG